MEQLRNYLLGVVCAAMAVAILSALLKDGAIKRAVSLVGGTVLLLAVLTPLVKADLDKFGQYLSQVELQTDEMTSGVTVGNKELMAEIIRDKTEAYILDKAAGLGAEITASVSVATDADYPYPDGAMITGTLSAGQKASLQAYLRDSLAIPEERQVFCP
ncbi:MAG: hypothetical protein VB055_07960 [Oscillospiraceae bacterium]|nr:hypothetical protein [Oscillospiraceae bacterium]